MSKDKFYRPVIAPSFTPSPSGIALSDLAQGTNGQIPIAQTGGATAYHVLSGDVTNDKNGAVTIGALAVTAAKAKVFAASQQTGTGSSQNVAHGLGVAPSIVIAVPTDGGTVVYGTHTSTNVVLTVTSGKKFDVFAWV